MRILIEAALMLRPHRFVRVSVTMPDKDTVPVRVTQLAKDVFAMTLTVSPILAASTLTSTLAVSRSANWGAFQLKPTLLRGWDGTSEVFIIVDTAGLFWPASSRTPEDKRFVPILTRLRPLATRTPR